jgi:UDP-N-acetylmuramoyl-L-alanyl-D-glutamate--2,6-diaminopimelate ligase
VTLPRTTPEASDLQRLLREMVDADVDVVALEVSSHALALHRVNGTRFRIAAFTNLMQDHLDFHGDMGSYLSAKRLLFEPGLAERAVVAVDDEAGRSIATGLSIPVTTVAVEGEADMTARDVTLTMGGSTFTVETPQGEVNARLPIPGLFNVQNALVAVAIGTALGIPDEAISAGLATVGTIPGRFEPVDSGQPFGVVVDYAHTPDAIAAVIASARVLVTGSVIAVVGAGGDRDKEKRPAMGAAASAADVLVVTSDNPRSEDPGAIIDEVVSGVPEDFAVTTDPDRRNAIRTALSRAGDRDLVLILGKGHEQGQEIAGRVLPFDDRLVVAEELELLRGVEA